MVVEPGRFGSDVFETGTTRPAGKIYYIDTAENVKAKIAQGSYDAQVRTISGWPPDKKIKWDVDVERGTSALRASLEVKDKELGIKALEVLTTSLEKEFTKKLETFQREFEQKILMSREDITKVAKDIERVQTDRDAKLASLQEEVKKLKKEIALLKQRELELSQEEENVRKNTELLMAKRNSLIEGGQSRSDPVALILYTTSLQQNIAKWYASKRMPFFALKNWNPIFKR
jgi:predicted RNase H-like nuclease (RuvC/YqgF family)